jgi:thymidylate synthase
MNTFEKEYSNLIKNCCKKGSRLVGRNGKVRQLTAVQIRANLSEGFPIVTGKQIFPKSVFIELEWMLNGFTNIKWLNERGVKIWDQWADKDGDLGPVYGHQILNFAGVNQLNKISEEFRKNKNSRRLLVSMWNPSALDKMALPPCHYAFQFVLENNIADIVVSMRSLDLFIGLPYDMAMYATLLVSFCKEHNLTPREIIINAANGHIYEEHIGSAAVYANRLKFNLPKVLNIPALSAYKADGIVIDGYEYHSRLKVDVKK